MSDFMDEAKNLADKDPGLVDKALRSVRDFARKEWPPSGAVWLMS
jgi:hypothetical protein